MIVGIHGRMGAGKDTLAKALPGYEVHHFADALKEGAAKIFNSYTPFFGSQDDKAAPLDPDLGFDFSGREVLTAMGAALRELDENVFVKLFFSQAAPSLRIAIADVRFPNEIEYIQQLGGVVIGLSRTTDATKSEPIHLSRCDYVIDNACLSKEETLALALGFLRVEGILPPPTPKMKPLRVYEMDTDYLERRTDDDGVHITLPDGSEVHAPLGSTDVQQRIFVRAHLDDRRVGL